MALEERGYAACCVLRATDWRRMLHRGMREGCLHRAGEGCGCGGDDRKGGGAEQVGGMELCSYCTSSLFPPLPDRHPFPMQVGERDYWNGQPPQCSLASADGGRRMCRPGWLGFVVCQVRLGRAPSRGIHRLQRVAECTEEYNAAAGEHQIMEKAARHSPSPKKTELHGELCKKLYTIVHEVLNAIPALKSTRPGSSSGLLVLSSLRIAVDKAKNLL